MKDSEFFDKILFFIEKFLEEDLDFRLNYSYVQEDDATYKVFKLFQTGHWHYHMRNRREFYIKKSLENIKNEEADFYAKLFARKIGLNTEITSFEVETSFGDKRELHSYEGIISFLEDILSKKSLNDI